VVDAHGLAPVSPTAARVSAPSQPLPMIEGWGRLPVPGREETQRIVDRLNEFVIAAKGRIYLTKDRSTRAEHFRAMEPRLPAFMALREKWDPKRRLRSAQSQRLFGDKA
jgi:FAD/FMN-containing dehydrogenase